MSRYFGSFSGEHPVYTLGLNVSSVPLHVGSQSQSLCFAVFKASVMNNLLFNLGALAFFLFSSSDKCQISLHVALILAYSPWRVLPLMLPIHILVAKLLQDKCCCCIYQLFGLRDVHSRDSL